MTQFTGSGATETLRLDFSLSGLQSTSVPADTLQEGEVFGQLDGRGLLAPTKAVMHITEAERTITRIRERMDASNDMPIADDVAGMPPVLTVAAIAERVAGVAAVEWLPEDGVFHISTSPSAESFDVLIAVGRALREAIGEGASAVRLHIA